MSITSAKILDQTFRGVLLTSQAHSTDAPSRSSTKLPAERDWPCVCKSARLQVSDVVPSPRRPGTGATDFVSSLHMKIVASDSKTAKELGIPDVPPNRRYDYAGCEMTEEVNEQSGSTLWTVKHKWVASEDQSQAA